MVTQQDINSVASSLKASLDQSVQAALSQQVQPNETLVTPVPCTSTETPDHKAGKEANRVQVTASETCTGEVYDTDALHNLLAQAVTQWVTRQVGNGYSLVGNLQTENHEGDNQHPSGSGNPPGVRPQYMDIPV